MPYELILASDCSTSCSNAFLLYLAAGFMLFILMEKNSYQNIMERKETEIKVKILSYLGATGINACFIGLLTIFIFAVTL